MQWASQLRELDLSLHVDSPSPDRYPRLVLEGAVFPGSKGALRPNFGKAQDQ